MGKTPFNCWVGCHFLERIRQSCQLPAIPSYRKLQGNSKMSNRAGGILGSAITFPKVPTEGFARTRKSFSILGVANLAVGVMERATILA
jgi:hypothetical protein